MLNNWKYYLCSSSIKNQKTMHVFPVVQTDWCVATKFTDLEQYGSCTLETLCVSTVASLISNRSAFSALKNPVAKFKRDSLYRPLQPTGEIDEVGAVQSPK